MARNLIVGAGLSGAVTANLIASELDEEVIVAERRPHIAGNCYDFRDKNGIMIHKYGSHIFHTSNEKVWEFVNRFTDFNNYEHKVEGYIDGIYTTIPFNLNSLYDVFEEAQAKSLEEKLTSKFEYGSKIPILEFQNEDDVELKELADFIYNKIFLHYTEKQWGKTPKEADSSITSRVPVYISRDNRYFQDKYQGIPSRGYTKLAEKMLEHKNIHLELNTEYKNLKNNEYKRIFYTGSIDEFFDYKYGVLPYRSVSFEFEEHNKEFYQNNSVVNYPCSENYTRIHEYKYYLKDKSPKTVIAKEYSTEFESGKNERFYPIPDKQNEYIYGKYIKEAEKYNNLYFLGRLGKYKYYNMDETILDAINLFESRILKETT